jgi:hypothetical protein
MVHAGVRMLEESTYFHNMFGVFSTPAGRDAFYAHSMPSVPFFIRWPLLRVVRQRVQESVWSQGAGRHHWEDQLVRVGKDLRALSAMLGEENEWFSAQKLPTTLDLAFFAMFAPGVFGAYAAESDVGIQALLRRHDNLLRHLARFLVFAFPDAVPSTIIAVPEVARYVADFTK